MDFLALFLFLLGLVFLIFGADILVRGASELAVRIGISPLIVGLTVVAFGTSAPELAVSLQSAAINQTDLALGNVVGSNIMNVLLILGLSAAIAPLTVSAQLVRLDVPIMIGVSLLLYFFGLDCTISRVDGLLLFFCLLAYITFTIYLGKKIGAVPPAIRRAAPQPGRRIWFNLGRMAAGLALLVLGARWLVDAAVGFARGLGISELIIGLTVVAIGTSLPEIATSVMAGIRGERDIAVGNVVGSNIFNILLVLGLTGVAAPGGIPVSKGALHFDLPVMLAVSVACLPVFFTGYVIARGEGILFLGYYAIYLAYLILAATEHASLMIFNRVMLAFVLPITAITLGVLAYNYFRKKRAEKSTGSV